MPIGPTNSVNAFLYLDLVPMFNPSRPTGTTEIQASRVAKVVQLFDRGLDLASTSLGFHGTSIQAIREIIRMGLLPPGYDWAGPPDHEIEQSGLIYIVPTAEGIKGTKFEPYKYLVDWDPLGSAKAYALRCGQAHFFLTELGCGLANHLLGETAYSITIRGLCEEHSGPFLEAGFSHRQISEAWRKTQSSSVEGVVLVLGREILDAHTVEQGRAEDQVPELKVMTTQGLELKYIKGIEPVGQYDYDYLNGLRT